MKKKLQPILQKYDHNRILQTCIHPKLDNLGEMDKFLETYNLLRVNQEETDTPKRMITSNEIESVIKKLPTTEHPGPDNLTEEFY